MKAAITPRRVAEVIDAFHGHEGAGFPVRRPFPTPALDLIDPFLLLDEFGPVTWAPGEALGAPDHPHRGFETVTYVLDGDVEHRDSMGNFGLLKEGDVQWMTAGAGVVHSEMPSEELTDAGGRVHGFQLWVNLLRKDKFAQPRYQDTPSAKMPLLHNDTDDVRIKLIAGHALDGEAVIETHTPIHYAHYTIKPGGSIEQDIPRGFNGFAHLFGGVALIGGRLIMDGQIAVLEQGDTLHMTVPEDATEPAEILLGAGQPINEPVARYGPFVMNDMAEIEQAYLDYQSGKMGRIEPRIG